MRIPRFTESWCGCSLQTGTKIISIVSVVVKLLLVILLSIACARFDYLYNGPYDEKYSATLAVLIVFLIASICDLMVSFLLVMAAYTQRPNLARPWLVVFMVSLTIDVVVFISSVTAGDLAVAITTPIRIGFGLYFWLVVYNFCEELRGIPIIGTDYGDAERAQEDSLLRPYQTL
ncbi:hypothetical protein DAPPUDRAFT_305865 [Daphnia pulex]|uniref:MARVEL domain-containing protein n=1 Tax=Daphnia pulex TaxID=6669 RepID=E9GTI9_DAPPU|nr:hypothetical protein DAPPUDRAFT_305865 [Daphnia pulex]|eukprot:EFX77207.1 hypothetical protein DAPPUDRAFT_305865 [Daphnia pulex]